MSTGRRAVRAWWVAILLVLASSAHGTDTDKTARDDAVALLADAVGERRFVLLGEMHGTREIPLLASRLVARYARTGPVLLGLEIDATDQPRVDAFLESGGTDADFAKLLSGVHWTEPMHDGRDSVAMLGLLEHVRRLRAGGADVKVVLFDAPGEGDRDQRMARSLRAAMGENPDARTLVLTGNVHAMTGEPPSFVLPDGTPYDPPTTLGRHLLDLSPLSIDIRAAQGAFWVCQRSCGPHPVPASVAAIAHEIPGVTPAGPSWDLRLMLPRFSASPPAAP